MKQILESVNDADYRGMVPVPALQSQLNSNPGYLAKLKTFAEAYLDYIDGQGHTYLRAREALRTWAGLQSQPVWLSEALGPSDFSYLFADTLQRLLLDQFQVANHDWELYAGVRTAPDFRDVKRFRVSAGAGLLGELGPGESYRQDVIGTTYKAYGLKKWGLVRSFFWEAFVNDDLDALRRAPADLAQAARNTEAYVVTAAYAANATLYSATHTVNGVNYSNVASDTLSLNALVDAISEMGSYPGDDATGVIINNTPKYIVVGSLGLKLLAEQILQSPQVMYIGQTDLSNLPTANPLGTLRGNLQVVWNPFLQLLDTNWENAWYLFSDPALGYAVEGLRLAGFETPSLFMRASAQLAVGGGLAPATAGSFDNDAVDYKIRHCFNAAHMNEVGGWRFTYYSDGTGGRQ